MSVAPHGAAVTVSRRIAGGSARWWNPCSPSAPLSARRSLLRTLFSLTSMLTLPRRRPASCTAVSPRGRIRTATSRTKAWWTTCDAGKAAAGGGRRSALEAASPLGAHAHDRQALVSSGHDGGAPRGHGPALGEACTAQLSVSRLQPAGRRARAPPSHTQLARAKQQWLFVEPCMREPSDGHAAESTCAPALQAATAAGLVARVL